MTLVHRNVLGGAVIAVIAALAATILPAGSQAVTAATRLANSERVSAAPAALAAYHVAARWGACQHGIPAPFQCASAPVPLNYKNPKGQKISVAMVRLPAADPKKRLGSLFINFGGPGGAGISDLVARADTVFSAAIRARFDLVSWDPRGIEYSDPVNCFASDTASAAYFNSDPVFPYPQSGEPAFFALNAELGKDCAARAGSLLAHVSTTDTARDLNLLRQDVGDTKLTYLGFSYGTVIGATYANLFPANVRAMVLDGSLDFVGNVTGVHPGDSAKYPIDVRQGVDSAGLDVFQRFLALCAKAGASKCAFAAGGNLTAKWATLLSRAQAGQLSYQDLMTFAYYDMEKPILHWPGLASYLQNLYTTTASGHSLSAREAAGLTAAADQAASQSLVGPTASQSLAGSGTSTRPAAAAASASAAYTDNGEEAYYAIQCADSLVPTKTSVYHNLANIQDTKVPGFGRLIVYDTMPCATWPDMHTDAYDGPWNRSRTTILVINALHDPFTPIWGARAGVAELHNARLLTVNGDGHTSMYVEPSACRDTAELTYLVSGKLPPSGKVCPVDALPFGL